jgi:hypothetical protein
MNNINNKPVVFLILIILILLALILGFGVIYFHEIYKDNIPIFNDINNSSVDNIVNSSIEIDYPVNNDIVDGKIILKLKYLGDIDQLSASIYDDNNEILGFKKQNVIGSETMQNIQIEFDISSSPTIDTGYILVGGLQDGQEITEDSERVNIKFLALDLANRLKIYSPLLNQVVSKEDPRFIIKGEMQGFFEGVMNYRVTSTNGSVLKQDIVNANGDNYIAYVPFIEETALDPLSPSMGESGRLEIYELSMDDGSERVLLSISLRFR